MTSDSASIPSQPRDAVATQPRTGAEQAAAVGTPDRSRELEASTDVTVSGTIRRVRRRAHLSQRELAELLGVSQSAVAKWETGRTTPTARMLARVLAVAGLDWATTSSDGTQVQPMRHVAARDAANRRYPAHTYVWAEGWWVPDGAATSAWFGQILRRSAELHNPRVRFSRAWGAPRQITAADVADHPTWRELIEQAKAGWQPRPIRSRSRSQFAIPSSALADSHRSRNRRPADYGRSSPWLDQAS